MQNTERDLKLYYSISEVAQMFDVNESLLRFWEKEFPQISPKKGSRGVRQYRKEDVENREATIRNFEIIDRLKQIRQELIGMRDALDGFSTRREEEQ